MSFFNGFWDLFDLLGIKRPKSSEQEAIQRELNGESSYGEGIAINKERTSRGNTGRGSNPFDITGGSSQSDMDSAGLTGGLPNLLGALASYFNAMTGADLTNAQKAQNQFNAQQAELQRDWEAQMSNTAYQRVVADMQAGGINPAMAWSNGAASTPSGASASSGNASNGLDMLSTLLQLKIQNKLADASIRKSNAETKKIETETPWIDTLNELLAGKTEAETSKIKADTDLTKADIDRTLALKDQILAEIENIKADTDNKKEQCNLLIAQTLFTKAETWQIYKLAPALKFMYEANARQADAQASFTQWQEALDRAIKDDPSVQDAMREAIKQGTALLEGQAGEQSVRTALQEFYNGFDGSVNDIARIFFQIFRFIPMVGGNIPK